MIYRLQMPDDTTNLKKRTKRDLTDGRLDTFLGYRITRARHVVRSDLVETLAGFDLRITTFSALALIMDNPGLSQSQLASLMAIERPNMVVIVDELENRGLIKRDRVPEDRRVYSLNATPAGIELGDKATDAIRAHEEKMYEGLDAATRSIVAEAMQVIRKSARS